METSDSLDVSGLVGGDVSIQCSSRWTTNGSSSNYSLYFCKGVCSSNSTLIQFRREKSPVTRRGRYGMEVGRREGDFNMTIKRLKKTDAGKYLCRWERNSKFFYQEISLSVLEAPTVPPGSSPSNTSLHTEARGSSSSGTDATLQATTPPATEKTNRQAPTSLKDTTVVIIVSVSLALLVCAIIPFIFYGHWRSNTEGKKSPDASKENEEHEIDSSAREGVQLRPFALHEDPECSAPDASQYATVYQALDPKSLD
ncbi:uncharacterized protein LOC142996955 [Genypterus blacodes]|uniref:uncharacterized protein LOC142996955 n=1 Tax=Genypterus blacodes TaxID=154954 RepID=UPI003F764720